MIPLITVSGIVVTVVVVVTVTVVLVSVVLVDIVLVVVVLVSDVVMVFVEVTSRHVGSVPINDLFARQEKFAGVPA